MIFKASDNPANALMEVILCILSPASFGMHRDLILKTINKGIEPENFTVNAAKIDSMFKALDIRALRLKLKELEKAGLIESHLIEQKRFYKLSLKGIAIVENKFLAEDTEMEIEEERYYVDRHYFNQTRGKFP